MKARLIIAVVVATLMFPPISHGFGLLRFVFDGVSNQLGLDRGPIAKTPPRAAPPKHWARHAPGKPGSYRVYIQAEGF